MGEGYYDIAQQNMYRYIYTTDLKYPSSLWATRGNDAGERGIFVCEDVWNMIMYRIHIKNLYDRKRYDIKEQS